MDQTDSNSQVIDANDQKSGLGSMLKDLERNSMIYQGPDFGEQRSHTGTTISKSHHNKDVDKDKYNPFHLYKWTTILYQMAVVYELIIVPLFWTVLFPGYLYNAYDDSVPEDEKYQQMDEY